MFLKMLHKWTIQLTRADKEVIYLNFMDKDMAQIINNNILQNNDNFQIIITDIKIIMREVRITKMTITHKETPDILMIIKIVDLLRETDNILEIHILKVIDLFKEEIKMVKKADIQTKSPDIKMKDSKDLEVDLGEMIDKTMMKVLMKREATNTEVIQDTLQDIMNVKTTAQEEIIWAQSMILETKTATKKGATVTITKEDLRETKDIMKMIKVKNTNQELQEDIKATEKTINIQEAKEEAQTTELIIILIKVGKKEDTQDKDTSDLKKII